MSKKLISIVTPCFNEEGNVENHFARVKMVLEPFANRYDFEHLYTDNCSEDTTFEKLTTLAAKYPNVKVMRFSRNIGPNRAIFKGLSQAQGDAVILILADLEDPPELLADFIRGWEEGYDVVYGQMTNREEGVLIKFLRGIYYRLVAKLAEYPVPINATEFRLTSKRVNDALKSLSDDDPYIRGHIAFIGYAQKAIPYKRLGRKKGRSSFNIFGLFAYALNGLTATTQVPIRLVMVIGFWVTLFGFGFVSFLVIRKLLYPESAPQGFTALISIVIFFAGVQLLSLGVIGEYIRKIYLQSLKRPKGFVKDAINIKIND